MLMQVAFSIISAEHGHHSITASVRQSASHMSATNPPLRTSEHPKLECLANLRSTTRSQDILEGLNLRPAARAQLTPHVSWSWDVPQHICVNHALVSGNCTAETQGCADARG